MSTQTYKGGQGCTRTYKGGQGGIASNRARDAPAYNWVNMTSRGNWEGMQDAASAIEFDTWVGDEIAMPGS